MKKLTIMGVAFCATMIFAACGNNENKETTSTEATTTQDAQPEEVTLTITGNDQMQFDKNELRVKPGQKVTLVMKNIGSMPKESMGHNWVLLMPYTDVDNFAKLSQEAGIENDYLPTDETEKQKMLAHTRLLGAGEEDTITFTAPDEGEYDYICSFPGHHGTMHGKLIVQP